jgi:hypothetical protein
MKWEVKLKLLHKKLRTNSDIPSVRIREPIRMFRNQFGFSGFMIQDTIELKENNWVLRNACSKEQFSCTKSI